MSFFKKLRAKAGNFKPSSKGEYKAIHSGNDALSRQPIFDPSETKSIVARSTNAAFQEAWDMHWQELTQEERIAWSRDREKISPLKVQKTIESLDKSHKERSITRQCAEKTLRFLRAVETLMAGAAIGIQQYPDVSSIVMGVIRVIINVAMRYFEYYEKLTVMLERLSDDLEVFDLYSRRSGCEPLLHKTLVAVYGDILAFCRHARRVFVDDLGKEKKQGALLVFLKVQWAPFEEQFGRITSDLEYHTRNLDKITAAITLTSTVDIKEEMNRRRSLERKNERGDFLRWISEEDSKEIHSVIRSKRYADTGSWLLSTERFEKWLSEDSSDLLWCFGQAGIGKSVLASMVIDHLTELSKQKDFTVAFAYLKGEDTDMQRLPVRVVSMFVKQLCLKMPALPDDVLNFYHKFTRDAQKPLFDDLQNLFIQCTRHFRQVFVIFDGLDECAETYRRPILEFICTVGTQCANVKVFVTSRWEHDIDHIFSRHRVLRLLIEPTNVKNDISEVVRYQVATELGHVNPDLQEEVIRILTEKSGGMFLWVDLQLKDLLQVPEADIKRQLAMLPTGLYATYVRVFQKMSMLPKTSRALAQKCFLWAFHAKELLNSSQFIDAVSLENKIQYHDGSPLQQYSAQDIKQVTSNLLQIYALGLPRVRPIHFSLREFFMDATSANIPQECQDFFPTQEEAHAQLAVLCLRHLFVEAPPADLSSTVLFYCAKFFDSHIRSLTTVPQTLIDLLDRLFWKEPRQLLRILSLRWPISHHKYPDVDCPGHPRSVDPNFFMRCTKLDTVPQIWSRYFSDAESRQYPQEYLHLASLVGLEDIVRAIVSRDDVDIDRTDALKWSPLHYACVDGQCGVVRLLLDSGADWNLNCDPNDRDYESPIQVAIRAGNPKVIDCFIERKDIFNLAVFVRSMGEDNHKAMKTLLDRGAEVNQLDEAGHSPLEVAISAGFVETAKLLVTYGAKANVSQAPDIGGQPVL
ncbi:hypothetical protein VTN77DRAFT_7474 [Rasamsonia byssochlamydoides]|uniref:uncharacterized protein n=1 Tax=Rasamsonia byssochlamydoides TaxID=89139 RepID=UPI00374435B0